MLFIEALGSAKTDKPRSPPRWRMGGFPAFLVPPRLTALAAHARIGAIGGSNIDLWLCRLICPCSIDQPCLDVARERVEGLVDVDVALCADLEEGNAEFVCKGLALFCGDGALLFPVALVADKDLVDSLGGMLFDIGEPCADVCGYVSMCGGGHVAEGSILLKLRSSVTS